MKTKEQNQAITMELDLPHPPPKVWRALTNAQAFDGAKQGWQKMFRGFKRAWASGRPRATA